ncbi:MAG: DNA polymerase III subunit alpha [Flavobacteriaceae bacterium]|nr:DNA polymerase III subunit alpha [Flavobacteriaceae bacterium]
MYLIFDTETTGIPARYDAPISDSDNWPRCVQLAWQLHNSVGEILEQQDYIIRPDGYTIPYEAESIHGISTALAEAEGIDLQGALSHFKEAVDKAQVLVGQNLSFDLKILGAEFYRLKTENPLTDMPVLDTCTEETAFLCKLPGGRGGKFKTPKLFELHEHLFDETFAEAHNASADVEATARCFFELKRRQFFPLEKLPVLADEFAQFLAQNPNPIKPLGVRHRDLKAASAKLRPAEDTGKAARLSVDEKEAFQNARFSHLHTHSRFSVLQATSTFKELVSESVKQNMPALAVTDIGNMMGAFLFVKEVANQNKLAAEQHKKEGKDTPFEPLKPIVGCVFHVCEDCSDKSHKDNGYQMVFLAKNKNGYRNLCKLSSLAFTQGFYYVPRIDKKLVETYKEDLIVLSGNVYGELYAKILNLGEHQAEEALLWWKETFADDFYIEINKHGQQDEDRANEVLLQFSKKHHVKIVATNATFYTYKKDAEAHDILLCVKDGEKRATPKGRGRGYRYGLDNQEYYFKSGDEMKAVFKSMPEAILNVQEVVDKIEVYSLAREVLLPKFDIPKDFESNNPEGDDKAAENAYLKFLTYKGAEKRYPKLTDEIRERIDFELEIIAKTGYPGYFLIVQDFIAEARKMDVSVGPGRGSAAGSAVAYCLGITNIDPIAYDLLFERFLNPERVSLPDIDIDFDDDGRSKVMDYVIKKYGANQVAQIITYGTMAAKSALRDTARVLDLSLPDADRLAKMIPDNLSLQKISLLDVLQKPLEDLKEKVRSEDFQSLSDLRDLSENDDLMGETIRQAAVLEGSLRNTGIHACGVIITPEDLTNLVPIATSKESDLYATQFDNSVVESAGLLKMDFLGLKTLTLIKDTLKLIKYRHRVELDPDLFPLDDAKTYELFQRGETVGIFQYESAGMQKYLRELKPTQFTDLIAMNALYRPGPMDYLPSFIKRKQGEEPIAYEIPEMEGILKETYGITVYQEQVMLLSQKLANFTKGEADILRKAMGKKIIELLNQLKPKFLTNGQNNGHPKDKLEKIWKDWEAFAKYAFNKSHATCYAWVAYQTAYLKANYPSEYMAAVLSNNMSDIKKVSFFMEECKRMGLRVLGPDVNESFFKFTVNDDNAIRFGMGAVKGVGAGAVETFVENRKDSKYKSVFDVAKRVNLQAANKKAFENLALAGAFDSFPGTHRAQYFQDEGDGLIFLEKIIRYGAKFQENENASQVSLFGDASDVQMPEPVLPPCESWSTMEKLRKEKEVVGIFISGHPLDDFETELKYFCNGTLGMLKDLPALLNRDLNICGIVSNVMHRVSKAGRGWATFTLDDYSDSHEFRIFGDEYLKHRHFLVENYFLYLKINIREGYVNKQTGQRSEPAIQYRDFEMLHDVREKLAKKLIVEIQADTLNKNTVEKLREVTEANQGNVPLEITLVQADAQLHITLPSRKYKVNPTDVLLESLRANDFHFRLN